MCVQVCLKNCKNLPLKNFFEEIEDITLRQPLYVLQTNVNDEMAL